MNTFTADYRKAETFTSAAKRYNITANELNNAVANGGEDCPISGDAIAQGR